MRSTSPNNSGPLGLPGIFSIGSGEAVEILIAVVVLAAAFANVWASSMGIPPASSLFLKLAGVSIIAVGTGFIFHEMAHRFVANRYGAYARFSLWPLGLVIALVSSFFGFIFAAPGAVYIYARSLTREQNGIISLAGPAMNIILGLLFFGFAVMFVQPAENGAEPVPGDLLWPLAISINFFLAFFNLIPIFPLDGSKVLAWNKFVWLGAAVLSLGLFALVSV